MKNTDAKKDFIKMLQESWPWKKLTDEQKNIYLDLLEAQITEEAVKGTYYQRWSIYQVTWSYFLKGISTESNRLDR